ncbi:MAG: hypothetical protein IPI59_08805 [Sphingobacteriales bacterium]|nr:hypothetical protein [Sphingobacteriales bacterium]
MCLINPEEIYFEVENEAGSKFIRIMPKIAAEMPNTCQIGQQVLVFSKFTSLGLIRFILRHPKKGC